MLTTAILVPLLGAAALALSSEPGERGAKAVAVCVAAVPLLILVITGLQFDPSSSAARFQFVEAYQWIPTLGAAWRVGVDGIALLIAAMSALLFTAAVAWPAQTKGRPRAYYAWFLFLEGVSLGVFLALDLLLFYVFFDLSLVGMYFLIGRWGHGDARRSALKFFVYTFAGSLVMLLSILGLCLGMDPLTFDMRVLIAEQPLAGSGLRASLVLLGFLIGLGIKIPIFPFHTWLPSAHVDAPGPASAILAGVLLKLGTFGLLRIPFAMMRDTFARYALIIGLLAVVSILYGALVALAQGNLKRRIAYTSVNHMGYAVLGIAAAGAAVAGGADPAAQRLALTGAVLQMVVHGLITGSLFLIAGAFWQRAAEYELSAYGGLTGRAPRLALHASVAAFASLGLPGLAGFVAEFQVFAGTFGIYPWLAGVALAGVLITAALFLHLLQSLFFGELPERWRAFPDLGRVETLILAILLGLVVIVGVYPRWVLSIIDAGVRPLVA